MRNFFNCGGEVFFPGHRDTFSVKVRYFDSVTSCTLYCRVFFVFDAFSKSGSTRYLERNADSCHPWPRMIFSIVTNSIMISSDIGHCMFITAGDQVAATHADSAQLPALPVALSRAVAQGPVARGQTKNLLALSVGRHCSLKPAAAGDCHGAVTSSHN